MPFHSSLSSKKSQKVLSKTSGLLFWKHNFSNFSKVNLKIEIISAEKEVEFSLEYLTFQQTKENTQNISHFRGCWA